MSDDFEIDGNTVDAESETIDLGGIADRIAQQREKSSSFLADQKSRLDSIEARLANEVDAIAVKLQAWTDYESQVAEWSKSVEKKGTELEQHREEFAEKDTELEQRRKEFEDARQQNEELLRSERAAIESNETEQLKQLHAEIEGLQVQLEEDTKAAAEARRERDELLAKTEGKNEELRVQLEGELHTVREALDESRGEKDALEKKLAQTANELEQRVEQTSSLHEQIRELSTDDSGGKSEKLLAEARDERDNLLDELAELRSQQKQQSSAQPALAKMHRKFELAVQKVRELKARNMKLEQRLSSLESAMKSSEGVSNCETHKKQAVAELEGGNTAEKAGAAKSAKSASVESDDLVKERENLKKLQEEWQDKLRAAEVEISIERAQNGRMRAELLEKMRDLEEQLDQAHKNSDGTSDGNGMSRGRWLDRLGLSEDDKSK